MKPARSLRADELPEPDEWRERKLARAAVARERPPLGTICCRMRGYRNLVPDLRISGRWLQRAGFDRGQHYEIEVRPGGPALLLPSSCLGDLNDPSDRPPNRRAEAPSPGRSEPTAV